MSIFDEIIVVGSRGGNWIDPSRRALMFESGRDRERIRSQRERTGGALSATAVAASNARAGAAAAVESSEFARLVKMEATPFQQLLRKPMARAAAEPLSEVVVTAKRIPAGVNPRLLSAGMRLNIAAVLGEIAVTLGAKIADEVSQQRLDESYRTFLATGLRKKPDTPVRTMTVQHGDPLPVVTVTAKRPRLFETFWQSTRESLTVPSFDRDVLTAAGPEIPRFERPTIKRPQRVSKKTPKLRTITMFSGDPTITQKPTGTTDPFRALIARPVTRPLLADGGQGVKPTEFATPGRRALALPQPKPKTLPQMAGMCPPCDKKGKTKKKRTKCYKKLVRERRNPANDTEYKWVQINCDTGKEM